MPRTPTDLKEHVCIRNISPVAGGLPLGNSAAPERSSSSIQPGPLSLDDHELIVEAAKSA